MMETISQLIALCRPEALGSVGVPGSLLLAGLAGSVVHCVGMCGPFVLGLVMADHDHGPSAYGEWRRLSGAALLPYHLGRLTTYAALGSLAGAATALFASTSVFGWLSGGLLVAAACLMIVQAFGLALGAGRPLAGVLMRLAAPLSMARGNAARYGLSMVRWRPQVHRPARAGRLDDGGCGARLRHPRLRSGAGALRHAVLLVDDQDRLRRDRAGGPAVSTGMIREAGWDASPANGGSARS
jgi:hypothetical protein